MISLETGIIQANSQASAKLAAAIAEFENKGGVICTLPNVGFVPRPEAKAYGRTFPAAAAPAAPVRRAAKPKRVTTADQKAKAKSELLAKAESLAATMTLTEVGRQTGLSTYLLRKLATEHGFQFQAFDPTPSLKPNKLDRCNDEKHVALIIAAKEQGLSQKAARDRLGMSHSLMARLIAEYSIDYPLQRVRK
jgi:hypothetical protein